MNHLAGKVAIVTGASKGIGAAIAKAAIGRGDQPRLRALSELRSLRLPRLLLTEMLLIKSRWSNFFWLQVGMAALPSKEQRHKATRRVITR